MILDAYEKCPIVIMPSDRWTSVDFVKIHA